MIVIAHDTIFLNGEKWCRLRYPPFSDLTKLETFVVGVAEGAVEFVAADSNVGAARPAAQGNVTDAAAEALEVVEQLQRLDHHRSPAT